MIYFGLRDIGLLDNDTNPFMIFELLLNFDLTSKSSSSFIRLFLNYPFPLPFPLILLPETVFFFFCVISSFIYSCFFSSYMAVSVVLKLCGELPTNIFSSISVSFIKHCLKDFFFLLAFISLKKSNKNSK